MAYDNSAKRYRYWYAKLLRFHSRPYYERFGEGMEQTFNDLLREYAHEGKGLASLALWVYIETVAGIIKENIKFIYMQKNIIRIAIVTGLLLLVPLIAMQFTTEVKWTLLDFIVAGILLFGTGLAYELVSRKAKNNSYKIGAGMAVGTALFLIWVNLAVGVIGDEDNPANILYLGVILIGVIGAMFARLKPLGMSRAMFVVALAQMLVPVIAFIVWRPLLSLPPGLVGVFMLNAFFAVLWLGSGLMFRQAGE